jgi:acetylglutamate kinase
VNDISVIKLGGSLLEDSSRRNVALATIVSAWNSGANVVLVHGGGRQVDAMLARLNIPRRTHAGLRITDAATLDVVVGVLAGSVNKSIVAELTAMGLRAAGFSGADAGTLVARLHPPIDGIDLGHVGLVTASSPVLLQSMLAYGILPVVCSIAQGPAGTLLNVNADTAAAAISVALQATSLRFLTDVAGVLDARGKVLAHLAASEAEALMATRAISGGMKPKLEAALGALRSGVPSIAIGEAGNATRLVAA